MRLIDADALKDAVKRYAGEPIKEKDRKCQAICLDMLGTIDAQPTASPWHRVEERLPNVGELVVGLDADGHAEITILSEAKCWLTYGLWIHNLGCYVWWMPLPEPPKEDA